jgi:hypothetical protein
VLKSSLGEQSKEERATTRGQATTLESEQRECGGLERGLLAETLWIDQPQNAELKNADDGDFPHCSPTENHEEELNEWRPHQNMKRNDVDDLSSMPESSSNAGAFGAEYNPLSRM